MPRPDREVPVTTMEFPADPIIESGAPADAPDLFGTPGGGSGGPCIIDPQPGSLVPQNWLRLRTHWNAPGGQNLFELRISVASQTNDLVVYTTDTTWTMPIEYWAYLATYNRNEEITVEIRGAVYSGGSLSSGPEVGTSSSLTIAPVGAPGAIVYWQSTGGSALRGFTVGKENVSDIVLPSQADGKCVGCHTSTPDGQFVGFSASADPDNGDPSQLYIRSSNGAAESPSFTTSAAQTLMSREYQTLPAFSPLHWKDGDRKAITMFGTKTGTDTNGDDVFRWDIAWTDLEATSDAKGTGWDLLTRTGDTDPATTMPNMAGLASFAHTSDDVLYVSSPEVWSGTTTETGDIAIVPFSNGAGGTARKVSGASDPLQNEYYPAFSSDDKFIAFNRVPAYESSDSNPKAEVFVIPAAGGTATRIAANDPSSCTGKVSPGITNSWPKWAPSALTDGSKTYYWLTFSSKREDSSNLQLYIAPVVVEGTKIETYPALYLWNQPSDQSNHTPAWDVFLVP